MSVPATCIARGTVAALFTLLSWGSAAQEHPAAKPAFTPGEIRAILSHGPFPAPVPHDPSNRVSGNRAAVEFGTKLFFDTRLSGHGTTSCATCHVPERNWSDNQRRGVGLAEMDRKTPTLWNLLGQHWFGWDGAADSLWFQSLRPILGPRELAATPRHVAELVRNDPLLSCRYRNAFGAPPSRTDNEAVLVDIGKSFDPVRLRTRQAGPGGPLNLTPQEQTDLMVFLESLTSFSNPWRPESSNECH